MGTTTAVNAKWPFVAKPPFLLVGAVLGMWYCLLLGPLSLAAPIVAFYVLTVFWRQRRFVATAILVVANPLSVAFLWGAMDYANGAACLRASGLPGTTFHNLDPELRCGRATSGCVVTGEEWMCEAPYNGAVRLMTACFGWMPNTYHGPYPTPQEAQDALASGTAVSIGDLREDRIVIGGATIALDEGVGSQLADRIRYIDKYDILGKPPEITACVWQEECIVLRIPVWPVFDEESSGAAIVLISRSVGRPFAYYGEGAYHHRSPPVPWKRRPK